MTGVAGKVPLGPLHLSRVAWPPATQKTATLLADEIQADAPVVLGVVHVAGIAGVVGGRLEVVGDPGRRLAFDEGLDPPVDRFEVEGLDLIEQVLAALGAQLVGERQQVVLAVGFQGLSNVREPVGHGDGHRTVSGGRGLG